MPENDRHDVARRDRNEPGVRYVLMSYGVELKFDEVMPRLRARRTPPAGKCFAEVEAHQFDIARQSQMRHIVERDRQYARRNAITGGLENYMGWVRWTSRFFRNR
jgi:hypothetical protein